MAKINVKDQLPLTVGVFFDLAEDLGVSVLGLCKSLDVSYSTLYTTISAYKRQGIPPSDALLPNSFNKALYKEYPDFYKNAENKLYKDADGHKVSSQLEKDKEIRRKYREKSSEQVALAVKVVSEHKEATPINVFAAENDVENILNEPILSEDVLNNTSSNEVLPNVRLATPEDGSPLISYKRQGVFKSIKIERMLNKMAPITYISNIQDAFKHGTVKIKLFTNSIDIHISYNSGYRYNMVNPLLIEYVFKTKSIVILNAFGDSRLCIAFNPNDEHSLGINYSAIANLIRVFIKEVARTITINNVVDLERTLTDLHKFLEVPIPKNILENNVVNSNIFNNIEYKEEEEKGKEEKEKEEEEKGKEEDNRISVKNEYIAEGKKEELTLMEANMSTVHNHKQEDYLITIQRELSNKTKRDNLKEYLDTKYPSMDDSVKNVILDELLIFIK